MKTRATVRAANNLSRRVLVLVAAALLVALLPPPPAGACVPAAGLAPAQAGRAW